MNPSDIDLDSQYLSLVKNILHQYVPGVEVRVFGSRINKTAKKFSDLDLVIMTSEPLPLDLLGSLVSAFSESTLPIKVDVLDWSRIDENFQKIIQKKYVRLQQLD